MSTDNPVISCGDPEASKSCLPGVASTCALIVAYHPEIDRFRVVVDSVRSQVDRLLIIDNGSGEIVLEALRAIAGGANADLMESTSNLGLAAAFNKGIAWATDAGCSHILFLDQDSVPASDMVRRLALGLAELDGKHARVAAVGPVIVDPRNGAISPFVSFGLFGIKRHDCDHAGEASCLPADFLISSGKLVALSVFEPIGLFDAELFIDNVDLEWCFRAANRGFRCFGICDARMEHYLGDEVTRIWLGRWFPVYRHGPVRQYYIMRNRVLLYKKRYSPAGWIVQDVFRAIFKFVVFSTVFGKRLQNMRMMLLGLRDGILGRSGPCRYSID